MYGTPQKGDVDRKLSELVHAARHAAEAARRDAQNDCNARGIFYSSIYVVQTAKAVDDIHAQAVADGIRLIHELKSRMPQPIGELAEWARPHFENLGISLLDIIPTVPGLLTNPTERAKADYLPIFRQRADSAIRDLEIGFAGRTAVLAKPDSSQAKALRLLKAIYDATHETDQPEFVDSLASASSLSEAEAQTAWTYLREKGFIRTFNIPFTAVASARGKDLIEAAERNPDQPVAGFAGATFNVVNIGTAIGSPIQQSGSMSDQTQSVEFVSSRRDDLERLVREFTDHLHELDLDDAAKRRAKAQLSTLEAQLSDDPDPVIMRQAGRTLRNITEGAIGGLIATAVQPTVWNGIGLAMASLFPN